MEGWVKLHRRFINWEWYTVPYMVQIFVHLLLSANHEPGQWRCIQLQKGQLITGRKRLAKDTGIPEHTIRTCLNRLLSTQEITIQSTNKYSIITICHYETWQGSYKSNQPAKTPTTDHKQEVKNKYIKWAENSKNETYKKFVSWFLNQDFQKVLQMDDQISERAFIRINQGIKITGQAKNDLVKDKILAMEAKTDLLHKYSSFARTLQKWVMR